PACGGQSAVLFRSCGQSIDVPVQRSATSQTPAAGRHTVVADASASGGHVALVPVQVSATSHGPAASRHTVVFDAKWSAGHDRDAPVQCSAASHGPFPALHTVVAGTRPPPAATTAV